MAEGEISEPIHTGAGWHVVQLQATRPAGVRPLSEVHDALVKLLRQKKQQEEEKHFVDQLLIKDQAAINEIALKQALEQPN
jgi:parvulin-like peptidyl-prolyl isomerase